MPALKMCSLERIRSPIWVTIFPQSIGSPVCPPHQEWLYRKHLNQCYLLEMPVLTLCCGINGYPRAITKQQQLLLDTKTTRVRIFLNGTSFDLQPLNVLHLCLSLDKSLPMSTLDSVSNSFGKFNFKFGEGLLATLSLSPRNTVLSPFPISLY